MLHFKKCRGGGGCYLEPIGQLISAGPLKKKTLINSIKVIGIILSKEAILIFCLSMIRVQLLKKKNLLL